jgi:leucine-rich repeat-containing protein 49
MSLLQIAKLENLPNLKIITIEPQGNPISHCTFLKEFVIYRFPSIIQINREDVKEADRNKAKNLFQNFDKVLQIPEKSFGPDSMRTYPSEDPTAKKDKNYLKSFNKFVNEGA